MEEGIAGAVDSRGALLTTGINRHPANNIPANATRGAIDALRAIARGDTGVVEKDGGIPPRVIVISEGDTNCAPARDLSQAAAREF